MLNLGKVSPTILLVLLPDMSKPMAKIKDADEFFPIANLSLSPHHSLQQRDDLLPSW